MKTLSQKALTDEMLDEQLQPVPTWKCGAYQLEFSKPVIMAIINLTPDSFSGDGLNGMADMALRKGEQALSEGATILDVGGESTRPGSESVSLREELGRVIPAIRALTSFDVPISVDTTKPEVMAEAISAGASIINDINSLREPGAPDVVSATDAGVCLMHMQGNPKNMQVKPSYKEIVKDVETFLEQELVRVCAAGLQPEQIALDPGFGFGKTLEHNLQLFRDLQRLCRFDRPLLIGVSRKTMLGEITGKAVGERDVATAMTSVLAAQRGVSILRVHNVAATRDALAIWSAIDQNDLPITKDTLN